MRADIVQESWRFLTYIAEPAARSLALGCFVVAALGALRVKSVRVKLTAWRGVLVAALAMPLAALVLPRIPLAVPVPGFVAGDAPVTKMAAAAPAPAEHAATSAVSAPAARSEVATLISIETAKGSRLHFKHEAAIVPHRASRRSGTESAIVFAPVDATPADETPATPAPARREIPWALLAVGTYLAIALMLLARVIVGMRFGRRLERAAAPIEDRDALAILSAASLAAGLHAAPGLGESELLSVPVALGVWRPVILFPAEWRTWAPTELEAVMVHEVSHVARRDALVQRLALIHRAIFWFSPLAWWLDRHLADLAEHASDEAALANGADRTRYAETLLGFFTALEGAPQRVWWHGVSMAKAGQAEKRVDRILAWRGAMSNRIKTSLAALLVAVAAPVLVLTAAVHPSIYNFQEPAPPPQPAVAPASPAPPAQRAPGVPPAPAVAPAPAASPAPAAAGTQAMTPPAAVPSMPSAPSVAPAAPMALQTPVAAMPPMPPVGWEGEGVTPPGWPQSAESSEVREAIQHQREALASMKEQMAEARSQVAAAKKQLSDSNTKAQMDMVRNAMAAYEAAAASYRAGMVKYRLLAAQAREIAEQGGARYRIVGNYSGDWGPRYVIVTKGTNDVTMSGSEEDADHARALRDKISGDFIWFERDEKSYIITDPGFIAKAKALFAPEQELDKEQDELGRQQDELGKKQDALGEQMEAVKVKIPDITPELERVRAELDALRKQDGGTQSELGHLQSELGRLQAEISRFQSDAGHQQGEIGRQQGELGRQQGEIGRKQGEIGRKQGELAREASQQLRDMFADAIAKGIAKPE